MELYLIRALAATTLLLACGLSAVVLLHRFRGALAASDCLRLTFIGVPLCVLLASAPAQFPTLTQLPPSPTSVLVAPPTASTPTVAPTALSVPAPALSPQESPQPSRLPTPSRSALSTLLLIWGTGSTVGFGALLWGHFLLRRLRQASQALSLPVAAALEVRESATLRTPLLAGSLRPVLYLPQSGPIRDDPQALEAALAHELAHLRRHDLRWGLFAQALCTALWFHPLLWLAFRLQAQVAEECCDESAVATTQNRRAYADLLLRLSSTSAPIIPAPVAGMALFRSRTGKRIAALLAARLSRPLSRQGKLVMGLALIALLLVGTSLVGQAQEKPKSTPSPSPTPGVVVAPRTFRRSSVTLTLNQRPLQEAVAELTRVSRYPITIAPGLRGTITLTAKNDSIESVLPRLCAQIQPTAWFRHTADASFELVALPPTGKLTGRVVDPSGKPVANVDIFAMLDRDRAGVATTNRWKTPESLLWISEATTDSNGVYTLERVGSLPYSITARTTFASGLTSPVLMVDGKVGTLSTAPLLTLQRGALLEYKITSPGDDKIAIFPQLKRESGASSPYPVYKFGASKPGELAQMLLPPGESTLTLSYAQKPLERLTVQEFSGGPSPVVNGSEVTLTLQAGAKARLQVLATLTPEAQKRRAKERAAYEQQAERTRQDFEKMKRNGKMVTLPAQPQPFTDAIRSLCSQVGQKLYTIAPELKGIVKPFSPNGSFEQTLEELCLKTTPVSYPIWEGEQLKIVVAPERGKFDPKTRLYHLMGVAGEAVYLEPENSHGSGGGGPLGISYADFEEPMSHRIRVMDYDTNKPLAGVTVCRETHGKLFKLQTDRNGFVNMPQLVGRNYFYVSTPGMNTTGMNSGMSQGEYYSNWTVVRNTPEHLALIKRLDTPVSLSMKNVPFQKAVLALAKQAGITRIKFLEGVTLAPVTVEIKNKPFGEALMQVCEKAKPGLYFEPKEVLTFAQFSMPQAPKLESPQRR